MNRLIMEQKSTKTQALWNKLMRWLEGQAKHDANEKDMSSETDDKLTRITCQKKDWYIAAQKEIEVKSIWVTTD